MRGPARIGLLATSVVCMFAFMAVSAYAAAEREIFNEKNGVTRTKLRSVAMEPKNQPDAGEFVNEGGVKLEATIGGLKTTITCTEIEIGTTVLVNTGVLNQPLKLAIPFGVAEGDNCKTGGGTNIITLFDTTAEGAVGVGANVASVAITGAVEPYKAKFANLKFSQKIPGIGGSGFCTGVVSGPLVEAEVRNSEGPFMEEMPPNLNVKFNGIKIPIENSEGATGCPTEGTLTGTFFLETPSTTTDTAWVE